METNPDLEFDFYLAAKLGWRSVAEMRCGMSSQERLSWYVYFARRDQDRQMAQMGG
jgi:hypothetical protein